MTDQSPPHSHLPSEPALRVKVLESLLVEKGLVDPAALDELIETFETRIGPRGVLKLSTGTSAIRLRATKETRTAPHAIGRRFRARATWNSCGR